MLRRSAGPLILIIAALASIATSRAAGWVFTDDAELEPVLAELGTPAAFSIVAEARGPAGGHEGGDLTVDLRLEMMVGELGDNAVVDVELISEADPTQRTTQNVLVSPGGTPTELAMFMPAWLVCEAGPCFDDFRLEVTVREGTGKVTVSGTATATLHGRDPTPEPDHEVVVTVTSLGAAE